MNRGPCHCRSTSHGRRSTLILIRPFSLQPRPVAVSVMATIVSKGIAAGQRTTYRGQVKVMPGAETRREGLQQCDSMLIGRSVRRAQPSPSTSKSGNPTAKVEHEASGRKSARSQDLLLQDQARNRHEDTMNMIVSGFCKEVFPSFRWSWRGRRPRSSWAFRGRKMLGVMRSGQSGHRWEGGVRLVADSLDAKLKEHTQGNEEFNAESRKKKKTFLRGSAAP